MIIIPELNWDMKFRQIVDSINVRANIAENQIRIFSETNS